MRLAVAISAAALMSIASSADAATTISEADCALAFNAADTNQDGELSAGEAKPAFDNYRRAGKTPPASLSRDLYMKDCRQGLFQSADAKTNAQGEAGAPFEGANSFTEEQARQRLSDHGLTGLSDLRKDDKGIWRAKATRGQEKVNAALDYKGNVVVVP